MRFLIGWDDEAEAELFLLYLNVDGNEAVTAIGKEALLNQAQSGREWDAVLVTTGSPDSETAFDVFQKIRRLLPGCPIVGACRTDEIFRIAQFMTNGLRSYVIRDAAGDFLFLLRATLESAVNSVRAEREQLIAVKLREEIESVRKLQESIIPRDLDSPSGYKICGHYESSQIRVLGGHPVTLAGGDYYDVFMLDNKRMVLLVGDASGHGMKACMSIMTMHTLIRMIRGNAYRNTALFVADVNRRLCEQRIVNEEGGFITLLYAVLRTDTHKLQWTSAGHPSPILHNLNSNSVDRLVAIDEGSLPLAITPDAKYQNCTATLPPNSRLLIYTDGLEEAFPETDHSHEQYGFAGIAATLQASQNEPLPDAMRKLFEDSSAYTVGSGRHDDTSVVMLERK